MKHRSSLGRRSLPPADSTWANSGPNVVKELLKSKLREFISYALRVPRLRGLLFDAHPSNSLVLADCGKEMYLVNSSDRVIGKYCYINRRAFDADKLDQVLAMLPNGGSLKTLVDIGSNIGTIAIHALVEKQVEKCVAFEPEPNNFRLLQVNALLNGQQSRLVAHNVALSDGSSPSLLFELSETNFGDHRVRVTGTDGIYGEARRTTLEVASRRLDEFLAEIDAKSALLWIDTQGFEGQVLSGGAALLKEGVPMVVEFWPYGLDRAGGYEQFVSAVIAGPYTTIVNLGNRGELMPCNADSFAVLRRRLGSGTGFTDLLIHQWDPSI